MRAVAPCAGTDALSCCRYRDGPLVDQPLSAGARDTAYADDDAYEGADTKRSSARSRSKPQLFEAKPAEKPGSRLGVGLELAGGGGGSSAKAGGADAGGAKDSGNGKDKDGSDSAVKDNGNGGGDGDGDGNAAADAAGAGGASEDEGEGGEEQEEQEQEQEVPDVLSPLDGFPGFQLVERTRRSGASRGMINK